MMRRTAPAAAISMLCCLASGLAETPDPGNLFKRARWASLDVIGGRVALSQLRLGQQSTLAFEHPESQTRELLRMAARTADNTSLYYEYQGNGQQWLLEVERGKQLRLECKSTEGAEPSYVRYWQPAEGSVRLIVDDGQRTHHTQASTLWSLALASPELCRQYLFPLFESLHPGWRLEDQAARVEAELLGLAADGYRPDRERWTELVGKLSDTSFQQRQAAHRELLEAGQPLIPFLATLDEERLSVEQRTRIQQIRRRLTLHRSDTPARVAIWLAEDREVWLALLERSDASTRIAAAGHLALLCGEPVGFDPQAAADQREQQLVQLRRKLGLEQTPILGDAGATSTLR